MRALIGLLILGCLFVMAASWQNRTTAKLQDQRSARYVAPANSSDGDTDFNSRLVFGRMSGREPLAIPEPTVEWRPDGFEGQPYGTGAGTPGGGTSGVGSRGEAPGPGSDPQAASAGSGDPSELRPVGVESTIAPRYARDFEYEVRPNDTLGFICDKHYEDRPLALHKIVDAVALYNDINANSIKAGDTILLPDAAVLFPDR